METNVIINDIYQNVLKKFYEAMQNIKIESAETSIDYIKNQLNYIIELLKKCQSGIISIDSIKLLSNITFNDFLTDKGIIEAVSSNYMIINESNIFIRKTSKFLDDDCSYFRIVKKDEQYIAIKYCKCSTTEEIISLDELSSFVSLAKVLNDSEYIGFSARQWINEVTILYSGQIYESENYFTLYRRGNSLELRVTHRPYSNNGCFQQIYRTERRNPYIKSEFDERCINNIDGIADRIFILKVIEEQLDKQYSIPTDGKGTVKPAVLQLT